MVSIHFDLGRISLVKGKKETDTYMVKFCDCIINPNEIAKIVLLFLLLQDEKYPKSRNLQGGDMMMNYLIGIMNDRKYRDPPTKNSNYR